MEILNEIAIKHIGYVAITEKAFLTEVANLIKNFLRKMRKEVKSENFKEAY